MANREVDVKVKYIPDTSALRGALSGAQNIEFKIGGAGLKKELTAPIQSAMREVNKAVASGADNKTLLKLFQNVNTEAEKVRQKISTLSTELNATFNSAGNQQMLKQLKQYEDELEKVKAKAEKWNSQYGNAKISKLRDAAKDATKDGTEIKTADQARKQKTELEEALKLGEELTQQDKHRLEVLKEYIDTLDERNKLQQEGITAGSFEEQRRDLSAKISDLKGKVQTESYNAQGMKEYAAASSYVANAHSVATSEINKINAAIKTEKQETKEAKQEAMKFGDIVTGTFLGTSISNLLQDALRRGVDFFKEYDEILTRTMMVTGQSREEVNALTASYNRLAIQLSSTTKDVAAAQLVFYQQGLGTSEALKMTEASIAISKTGGIEAGEAANRLTAAIRGYKLAAGDAMDIADKMSALDAAAASSVDELTIAMQKSASQARMAGLDLDYYMAYLSTMQEVTREAPENIGTAMKSITSRLQEITDIGKVEEDGTTFSNVAKALNSVGIAAVDSTGQLRSLQDVMNDLGPMWATLDKNHKAYLATTLAGNRQQSRFIALMDNYDRAMELVNVSQNASGESAKQLRAYNQGLEASFTRLSNAWQQFATNVTDSSAIKKIIDLLSTLVEIVNKLPKGLIHTVTSFVALSTILKTINTFTRVPWKENFSKWLGLSKKDDTARKLNSIEKAMNGVTQKAVSMGKSIKKAFDGFGNNKYIEESTNRIKDFTNAKKAATTAQINSNSAQVTEAGLNENITVSAKGAANAYKAYNEELFRNATALAGNDVGQTNEIKQNLENMTSEIFDVDKEIKEMDSQIDKQFDKLVSKKNRNISEELMNASPNKRRGEAEKYLRSKSGADNTETLQDLLSNNKKNTQKLTKDTQKDLLNFSIDNHDEIVKFLEQENESAVKQMSDALDDLVDKRSKLLENKQNKISNLEQYKTTIESSPAYQKALSKYNLDQINQKNTMSLPDMKTILGDKNLGNIEKISAFTGKLNIGAGLVASSLAQMGASIVGLEDDEASALSTTVGLATAFAKFAPPWGAIIGASIGVVGYIFDKLTVSAEEAKASLEKINEEQDALTTKSDSINGALDTYRKLATKVDITEEEQTQLNDAANELANIIPTAVRGYDAMGNAIIDVTRAQEELNSISREQVQLAKQEMKSLNDLQEANDGWDFTRWLLEGVNPANWGNKKTAGEKQREDRVETAKEYESDISDYFITIRNSLNKEMDDTSKEIFNKVSGVFASKLTERIFALDDTNLEVKEATQAYENLLTSFINNIDTAQLQNKITELQYTFDFGSYNFTEAADKVREEVETMLAGAGYTTEEINQVINVVMELTLDGSAAIIETLDNIDRKRKEILSIDYDDRTDADKRELEKLEYLEKEIKALDTETASFASKLGLLDESAVGFIRSKNGIQNITNSFKDANGNFQTAATSLNQFNDILKRTNELEQERDKIQNQLKNGELTWSGGKTSKDFVSEERPGWAGLKFSDATYAKAVDDAVEKFKGEGMTEKQATAILDKYGIVLDGQAQILIDLYNKWIGESDQKQQIEEVNGELKVMSNYLTLVSSAYPEEPSFGKMKETLDDAISSAETLYGLLEDLAEQSGKMSAQNVSTMFGILDELQSAAEDGYVNTEAWSREMNNLANGFGVVNGQVTLNKQGQEALIRLQEESIKASYREQLADLEASEAKLENQKAIMVAYLNSLRTTLSNIQKEGKAKYDENIAEKTMKTSLGNFLDEQKWAQVESTKQSLNEQLNQYAQFFTQIDKMYTQMKNGQTITFSDIKTNMSSIYNKIMDPIEKRYQGLITNSYDDTVKNLQSEISSVEEVIGGLNSQLDGIKVKKTVAQYMVDATKASEFLGEGAKKASDKQSEYNEKLERTLTLLEKIEGLQHKIDENETFKDLYKEYSGEDYGRLLMNNLDLVQQQYGVYKDLFAMQQEMTNQAAGDLLDSPYGRMFKIMENGDIGWADASMYDKYKNLPDDMQEDIDNLVEAFQKQRDALRDTENDLAKYAQEVKKVREELVEMEVYIENELVDAIKNREKVLHDARMKALDDEVDMIEKAVEKRKKARETENQNKELYQAQEALRRATLDSSGKNNAQLLQLQQDLEDKQLEISEKRFEDDMDDRKQWLQDTKDAETETYEYRLETMTWYWEQVQEIQEQGTEAMMLTLITWNEEYRQQSTLQQSEMRMKWQETMDAMKKATDMGAELGRLTQDIIDVTHTVESMDIQIQKLPGTWQKATDAANAYTRAAQAAGSYSYGGGTSKSNSSTGSKSNSSNDKKDAYYTINITDDKRKACRSAQVKKGGSYTFSGVSGYYWDITPPGICVNPGASYTLKNITSDVSAHLVAASVSLSTANNFNKFSSAKNGLNYVPLNLSTTNHSSSLLKRYASGGTVDYTGPAWVDGTKSHPEAFLSAYQTEQIGALAGALDNNTVNNVSGDTVVNLGSVNFSVASMSSAADGQKALDVFVKGVNDMMAKKGVGTTLNMNMK